MQTVTRPPTKAQPPPDPPQDMSPLQKWQALRATSLLNHPAATTPNAPPAVNPYGISSYDSRGVAYQAVDPNELVSGQLKGLLNEENPYIQQAIAQATQQSASRGLLNSSMAAGAGELAAIQSALPIAQANAQQYSAVGAANQGASNQQLLGQTAADAQVQSALASAGATTAAAKMYSDATREGQQLQFQEAGQQLGFNYAQLGQQGKQFNATLGQQAEQFNASQAQQAGQFNQTLNANLGMFQAGQSWAQYQLGAQQNMISQQDYANMFGNIMMNPNLTPEQRSSALANAHDFYQGMATQNATIPAWVPPYVNNPNYWTGGG